jgi:hypothetical protein
MDNPDEERREFTNFMQTQEGVHWTTQSDANMPKLSTYERGNWYESTQLEGLDSPYRTDTRIRPEMGRPKALRNSRSQLLGHQPWLSHCRLRACHWPVRSLKRSNSHSRDPQLKASRRSNNSSPARMMTCQICRKNHQKFKRLFRLQEYWQIGIRTDLHSRTLSTLTMPACHREFQTTRTRFPS